MKILYVITGLGMGGAETITIDVAQKMLERGHEVAVLYLTGDNLQQHRIKLQMEIIGLHMKKSPIGFLRALKQARIYVNMFSPNVVHAQMFHANLFCRILRLFTRMPFLIYFSNLDKLSSARARLNRKLPKKIYIATEPITVIRRYFLDIFIG